MAFLYTCRYGVTHAVPDNYAGRVCDCLIGVLSPVSTTPGSASHGVSSGVLDGGRSQSDVASGSPGREVGKASQRSPQGQGKPIEALTVDEAAKTAPVAQDDDARAEAWMTGHFFKKKGMPGAVGDEWRDIVAACKAFGLKEKESWRDWVYSRWQAGGEARAQVVRMLMAAKIIPGPEVTVSASGKPAPSLKSNAKALLAALDKTPDKPMTKQDLIAASAIVPEEFDAAIEKLVDGAFAYSPFVGKYQSMKGGAK